MSAPAGAGKTTLTADFLAHQSLPALWYQMDAGDTDPSAFFHYLAMASQHLREQNPELPSLTAEYHGDLAIFARRFAEYLCAGMQSPAIFVFDNFQDLPEDSPLQPLFSEFIAALPAGFRTFCLSREKPPIWFACFAVQNDALLVDWDNLRLSETESIGITRLLEDGNSVSHSDADIRQIHYKVDGWAAGLVLILRLLQKNQEISLVLEDGIVTN